MSLRTLQRRVAALEKSRKPRLSPIVIAYGSFDAFAMEAYLEVEAGTLSGEFLFLVDALRSWELPGGVWDAGMQPADSPAWLVAYHAERGSSVPAPSPPKVFTPKPVVIKLPPPPPPVRPRGQAAAIGIIEPEAWEYDGGKRREPVVDADHTPPRIVRRVGWHHCLKCRRPYFSEDVVRLRMCDPCREDEDRFT